MEDDKTLIKQYDMEDEKTLIKQQQEQQEELEDEEFRKEFECCICLDLLYKPVVLGCGHISCFWCVFNTMNAFHESYCPICRDPFNHFPSICQLMHFLLQKLYPGVYERRGKQVEEEEKEVGFFSPQFDNSLSGSHRIEESNILGNVHSKNSESCSSGNEATGNAAIQEGCSRDCNLGNGTHQRVSVSDLLCAACKNLLFQPVVLNCGHVYCESCINIPADGISKCQICQSMHPKGFPSVCKILEHFLEEQYPEIYLQRQVSSLKLHVRQRADQSSSTLSDDYLSCWAGQKVHYGVGCDCCGVSPIIGERYKCKDCVEKIGFDLCGACYNEPSNIPGRFNQQHKPEHKLELVPPGRLPVILYQLDDDRAVFQEDLETVTAAPIPEDPENGPSNVQNGSPAFVFSADSSVDLDDDSDGSALPDLMQE
ncbi:E3 ubiquitin-protein ligase PRT1-like [Pyrus ussuriensis x Pyrus communis]|uniref:E3 ubiquitin-protein ligase PRT1-like n=1 Tax=Pyrus ussuriensis x Pyrus communis TaxID=2448454 RepID=A0A5N5FGW5_9ROSA|nr:E3 ubiquitin-protein ligase PRT1-like [Pyrus x bretschneideri]KAB2600460.1 E3 ubiquitin-protein ligase PRT1-like [Pyrus ussuriensis x Pyrus communis]